MPSELFSLPEINAVRPHRLNTNQLHLIAALLWQNTLRVRYAPADLLGRQRDILPFRFLIPAFDVWSFTTILDVSP